MLCLIWLYPLILSRKSSKFNICLLAQSYLCLRFHPKGKVNPENLAENLPLNTEADISYTKVCTGSLFQSNQHRNFSLNCYHSWTKIDVFKISFPSTEYSNVRYPRVYLNLFLSLAVLGFFPYYFFCWPVGAVCYCRQHCRRGLCEQAAVTWRWKNPAVLFASHLLQLQYKAHCSSGSRPVCLYSSSTRYQCFFELLCFLLYVYPWRCWQKS